MANCIDVLSKENERYLVRTGLEGYPSISISSSIYKYIDIDIDIHTDRYRYRLVVFFYLQRYKNYLHEVAPPLHKNVYLFEDRYPSI